MLKTAQAKDPRYYLKRLLSDYSYWLSFFLLVIVGRVTNPNFFRWTNISNIFVQSAPIGIIALGMTMVICAGQIDISVGAQVAIISGLSIMVLNFTSNIWITLLFCLALGLCIGTFTGLLVSKGHMPAMIATLAVQTACRSIINQIGQGGPFTVADKANYDVFRMVAAGNIPVFGLKIPYPMIMLIAFALLFGLIMQRTKLGKHVYALGSNETSARLAGVSVDRVKTLVFTITGLLCGFAGWLYASRVMAVAAASAGNLFEMDAIAAVVIGGASLSGGEGTVTGTIIGAAIIGVLRNALVLLSVDSYWQTLIIGCVIILAVTIDQLRKGRK